MNVPRARRFPYRPVVVPAPEPEPTPRFVRYYWPTVGAGTTTTTSAFVMYRNAP